MPVAFRNAISQHFSMPSDFPLAIGAWSITCRCALASSVHMPLSVAERSFYVPLGEQSYVCVSHFMFLFV